MVDDQRPGDPAEPNETESNESGPTEPLEPTIDESESDDSGDDAHTEAWLVEESDELDLGDDERPVSEPADDEPADDKPGGEEPAADRDDDATPADAGVVPSWFTVPRDGSGNGPGGGGPTDAGPPGEESPRRRRVRLALLGALAVLGVLYVIGFIMTGFRMPANATIGGVDVSGMSPGDARAAVDRELSPRVGEEVVLEHRGKEFTIAPKAVELSFDLDRSIDNAGGQHSFDPRTMVGLVFGTHEFAPAVDADDAKLAEAVASIADTVDRDVIEPQITFPKGEPKARQPKAGLVVRKGDAAQTIEDSYLVARDPVPVPTAVVDPSVGVEGLEEAMKTIAEPAVSGPVLIKVGKKRVKLPVSAYAPALVVRVVDGQLKPEIDPETLAKPLTNSTTGIGKKAVDATVKIRNGKPVVVPGKEGIGLQPEEMAKKLIPAITETGDARSVEIEAKVVDPEFTTKDAKKLRIKERVSSFSTFYPHANYRNVNQARAAELIDGTILEPGETFSMNNQIGERTTANGFTKGFVISGGRFAEELGGGVSQVATTTYNAAFFAGMDDVEHHPHAFYISRYPVGREATVYFGSLDLRFRNPTKYGVLINAYVNPSSPGGQGEMHVEMWSTKTWTVKAGLSEKRNFREPGKQYDDTDKCVPQEPIEGFDVDVYRTFLRRGEVIKRETDTVNYRAADKIICGKKPKD